MKKRYWLAWIFLMTSVIWLTSCSRPSESSTLDQFELPEQGEEIVIMETNMGTLKMRLFENVAPETVAYFKGLIESGYYDGKLFSRVEVNLFNQVDYDLTYPDDATGKTEYPIETDSYYRNFKGAVSMVYQRGGYQSSSFGLIIGAPVSEEILEIMRASPRTNIQKQW